MAYQGDWAVILPENDRLYEIQDKIYERAQRKELIEQQKKKEEDARQGVLANTIGDAFADKDYLTGSAFDPAIRQQLSDYRAKFAAEIKANPGMSQADLMFRLQKSMGELGQAAAKIKAVRTDVRERAKAMGDKQSGLDGSAIERLAMDKFAFKTDDKGQRVMKSLQDIIDDDNDPETLIGTAVQDHPEAIVNQTEAWDSFLKNQRVNKVGKELQVPGKTPGSHNVFDSDLELLPWHRVEDEGGRHRLDKNGKPVVFTSSKKEKFGDTELDIADDETYGRIMSTPSMKLLYDAKFKKMNTGLDPNSQEAQVIKRRLIYNDLSNIAPPKSDIKRKEVESAQLQKWRMQQAGMTINVSTGSAEEKKKAREEDKFNNSSIGLLKRSMEGDIQVYGRGKELSDGSFDVTDVVGKLSLGKTALGKTDYAKRITVNPDTKMMTIYPRSGKPVILDQNSAMDFLTGMAKYNGLNLDKTSDHTGSTPDSLKSDMEARKASRDKTKDKAAQLLPKSPF